MNRFRRQGHPRGACAKKSSKAEFEPRPSMPPASDPEALVSAYAGRIQVPELPPRFVRHSLHLRTCPSVFNARYGCQAFVKAGMFYTSGQPVQRCRVYLLWPLRAPCRRTWPPIDCDSDLDSRIRQTWTATSTRPSGNKTRRSRRYSMMKMRSVDTSATQLTRASSLRTSWREDPRRLSWPMSRHS